MLDRSVASSHSSTLTAQQRMIAGLAAALLGTFMLIGVGFAHSGILHNAAHDTRHAFTFPCH